MNDVGVEMWVTEMKVPKNLEESVVGHHGYECEIFFCYRSVILHLVYIRT